MDKEEYLRGICWVFFAANTVVGCMYLAMSEMIGFVSIGVACFMLYMLRK